jgi:hypothetical protein
MFYDFKISKSKSLIFWFGFTSSNMGVEITLIPDITLAFWKGINVQLIFHWLLISCGIGFCKKENKEYLTNLHHNNSW